MRIVEKLLYGIAGLLALILLFIALCHKNPEIAEKIGKQLNNKTSANVERAVKEPETDSIAVKTIVVQGMPLAAEGPENEEADEKLSIPSKVAGLTGYIPIKSTGTEITQTKADEILSSLSKGKTGENLKFDETMYPYYYIINETQKALYRQIYANADAMKKYFAPVTDVNAGDLKNAFTAVVNDHPELFWVETAYKYKYAPLGQVADITLVFNSTANDIEISKAEMEKAAKNIIDKTYGYYTDYEKEKISHDELIKNVKYDANAPINQSAYSALVYGRTVCAGYARALQYVLQKLDIPCYYVTGYAGENHAWNIVKLDNYYNVDSTWDDTDPNTYDYFNCSDADYSKNHVRKDLSVYLPPCNGSRYSGLEVNPSETVKPADTAGTTTTKPSTTTSTTTTEKPAGTNTVTTNTAIETTTTVEPASITVQTVRGDGDKGYIGKIEKYYIECFEAMMAAGDVEGIGFDLIITDEKLWDKIYKAYDKGECQEGYIERYLVEKHKNSCNMSVTAWPREDGSWLLRHDAVIN